MFNRLAATIFLIVAMLSVESFAESKREYHNRFRIMLDGASRANEYIRQHLGDKELSAYAHRIAEVNALEAEKMTPPKQFALMHPHFLLVLENIERSFFFASKGNLSRYRHHQKVVRKEIQIVETLAGRERIEVYLWGKEY